MRNGISRCLAPVILDAKQFVAPGEIRLFQVHKNPKPASIGFRSGDKIGTVQRIAHFETQECRAIRDRKRESRAVRLSRAHHSKYALHAQPAEIFPRHLRRCNRCVRPTTSPRRDQIARFDCERVVAFPSQKRVKEIDSARSLDREAGVFVRFDFVIALPNQDAIASQSKSSSMRDAFTTSRNSSGAIR